MRKALFVILAVLMMVGLMSGVAFADWSTGLDNSPAFEVYDPTGEGFYVYQLQPVEIPLAFCAGETQTYIRVVPGSAYANADGISVVHNFNNMSLVDPMGVWPLVPQD